MATGLDRAKSPKNGKEQQRVQIEGLVGGVNVKEGDQKARSGLLCREHRGGGYMTASKRRNPPTSLKGIWQFALFSVNIFVPGSPVVDFFKILWFGWYVVFRLNDVIFSHQDVIPKKPWSFLALTLNLSQHYQQNNCYILGFMMQASAKCFLISENMFQGKYPDEIVAAWSIKRGRIFQTFHT